jgi:hypothetical protein
MMGMPGPGLGGAPSDPSQAFNGSLQGAGPVDNQMPLDAGAAAGPPVIPPQPTVATR